MAQKEPVGMALAKFDYVTNDSHELNIRKGEKLTLLDDSQHWWQVMNSRGDTGYVPSNFCKKSKQSIFSSLRNTLGRKKSKESSQPVSCGTSSIGTAPFSASGRRSLTASPKNTNTNILSSQLVKNGSMDDTSKIRLYDNGRGHNGSGYPFHSLGSMKSNDSTIDSNVVDPKTTQSMSYNIGKQIPMSMDKYNQSQPNLPMQMPHYPMHKIPCNESQSSNSSLQQSNGRGYFSCGGSKSKNPISNSMGENLIGSERSRQESRIVGSGGDICRPYTSDTGSLGPSTACVAKFSYTPCQTDELALSRGDKIRVLERSSDGWWRGELINSSAVLPSGWFPSNYVTLERLQNIAGYRSATDCIDRQVIASSQHHSSMPSVTSGVESISNHRNNLAHTKVTSPRRYSTVLTLYPFSKNQTEEMSFGANEILEVMERPADDPDWWRCRNENGDVGLVPRNYVKQLTSSEVLFQQLQPLPQIPDQETCQPTSEADKVRLGYNKSGLLKDRIWYWGNIWRIECESLLMIHGYSGQFVIRDSESHPGDLTITMHAGAKCRNFMVNVLNGEYNIGQKVFTSVEVLLQHYRSHPIYKSDNDRLFLSDPFQYQDSMSDN